MQRFAGKSLPIEKFAAKKSKRFFEQGENLVLPGVELIFVWNGFKMMAYSQECIQKFLVLCDGTLTNLQNSTTEKSPFYYDNMALATLLKGVCLRYSNKIPEAVELMNKVLNFSKKIKEDLYILPFTEVELAQIAFSEGRFDDVKTHIHNAKSFKGYSLESRLHFRMHGINLALSKVLSTKQSSVSGESWDYISLDDTNNNNNNNNNQQNGESDLFHDCDSDISERNSTPT